MYGLLPTFGSFLVDIPLSIHWVSGYVTHTCRWWWLVIWCWLWVVVVFLFDISVCGIFFFSMVCSGAAGKSEAWTCMKLVLCSCYFVVIFHTSEFCVYMWYCTEFVICWAEAKSLEGNQPQAFPHPLRYIWMNTCEWEIGWNWINLDPMIQGAPVLLTDMTCFTSNLLL